MTPVEFMLYSDISENISVNVAVKDETIWLTQKSMAELFGVNVPAINKHLNNIFAEGELAEKVVISKMEIATQHGAISGKEQIREVNFYNLDAIISVGYRVNSTKATKFRIWATGVLKEFIQKGFVLDDERLKQGKTTFGKDYFKELLERVRSIRASERRIWQQITDIFAECSIDYNKNSSVTKDFFAAIQNKFHYAITHQTAAEIIYKSADSSKKSMGLTTWKNAPLGRILKSDVLVAKNYLSETEIGQLERLVSAYLDLAEMQAIRHIPMTMTDWEERLNGFLTLWDHNILQDNGKISAEMAKLHAETEFEKYRVIQDKNYISDFDELLTEAKNLNNI